MNEEDAELIELEREGVTTAVLSISDNTATALRDSGHERLAVAVEAASDRIRDIDDMAFWENNRPVSHTSPGITNAANRLIFRQLQDAGLIEEDREIVRCHLRD
jgi:hypothetical protein